MEKILVTGAAGFIGSHLCESLIQDGNEVLGLDNLCGQKQLHIKKYRLSNLVKLYSLSFKEVDICNIACLDKVFDEFRPNKVIHLAAKAGIRSSYENNLKFINSNIVGFANIIDLSAKHNVEGFIYASSSSVYGDNKKMPFSTEDCIVNPLSVYAATKISNEMIAKSYSNMYELNTTGLRFFNVYGPKGRPDMAYYIFTDKIYNNVPIFLHNFGNMDRDLTYIDDIINGIKLSISKNYQCEVFNLGNGKSENLQTMVKLIEKMLNKKAIIKLCDKDDCEMIRTCSDIDKTKRLLGYKPEIDIELGMKRFIEWYKNYNLKVFTN